MSFPHFLDAFIGELARDDFYQGQSFTAYLRRPAAERGGDEADIVDLRITKTLINALGYEDGEVEYNRAGANGTRPDFRTAIPEYPRPCFIVEDKNTAEEGLSKHAPQLEAYMRAYGAPRGILVDGKRLIAFDIADAGLTTSADISLFNIVHAWRGENFFEQGKAGAAALAPDDRLKLQAFYARFNRDAYANSTRLVEDLTKTMNGQWHAANGSTWPSQSAIPVVSANDNIGAFIANTRGLIHEVQLDVEAQLSLRLEEFDEYEHQLTNNPDDPTRTFDDTFAAELTGLTAELRGLGLPEDVIEGTRERLVEQYRRHTMRALGTTFKKELLEALTKAVEQRERAEEAAPAPSNPSSLFEGTAAAPQAKRSRAGRFRTKPTLTTGVEAHLSRLDRVITMRNEQRSRLEGEFAIALETQYAYRLWRDKVATLLMRTEDEARLRKEFAAQTAYVLIIRLLLIRICEDKGILDRMFTNGGLSVWFRDVEPRYLKYAQGRGTDYLLEMAYASAQHVYKHFYSQRELFDWYRPDRNLVIKVLHRLAGYDLQRIDHDLIGHIYSGYVQDEHKHETGMYYTPPQVVEYMLDRIGWKDHGITGSRILDPACGSGTFLVVAARRLLEAHRAHYRAEAEKRKEEYTGIPVQHIQSVLNSIRDSIYGLDLNPFACYLAETNLLVQVLDEIKRALDAGEPVTIDQFNIHNTDTLRYDATTIGVAEGTLQFPAEQLPAAEQIKLKAGEFARGFSATVLNPPYVKANEGAEGLVEYRNAVKAEHPIPSVRQVLTRKWDLYVPFIALAKHLLAPGGRMAVITSDSIEAAAYAEALREQLVQESQVDEISFFPNQNLFSDARVGSLVLVATAQKPSTVHETLHRWHDGPPTEKPLREASVNQIALGGKIFRQLTSSLPTKNTIPLGDICYIATGMVLNSDEKRFKGLFKNEDLVSSVQDAQHPKPYIEGKDIDPFVATNIAYLEYGPGLRAPEQVRRPTFPELYDRPKLIAQMSPGDVPKDVTQVILDFGDWADDYLLTNMSGTILMPWNALADVSNRSLASAASGRDRKSLEKRAACFDIFYLAGVINSATISEHMRAERSAKQHVLPDDYKALPVPDVGPSEQKPISDVARSLHDLGKEFFALGCVGWTVNLETQQVVGPLVPPPGVHMLPLSTAKVRWGLTIHLPDVRLDRLSIRDNAIYRGASVVISSMYELPEGALEYLMRLFQAHPEASTFTVLEGRGVKVPAEPKDAVQAFEQTKGLERQVAAKVDQFHVLRGKLNELVAALYK